MQRAPECLIRRALPDFPQGLLRRVAERVILVTALRERRDAARQRTAICSNIHDGPRAAAQRPWGAAVAALETHPRLRGGARGAEGDAEGSRDVGGAIDVARLFAGKLLVQCLIRPRLADGILLEEHQPLQIDFPNAGFRRDANEFRQLLDGFAESRQPGRHARLAIAIAFLQVAKGAYILEGFD